MALFASCQASSMHSSRRIDDDGQDHTLIFVSLELAKQSLGRFPDVAGEVVELRFVEREGHS